MPLRRVKVAFFKARSRNVRGRDPWPRFPADDLAEAIEERADSDDRYVKVGPNLLLGRAGPAMPAWSAFSVYKVRSDRLPDEERDGEIRPLDLDDDTNLAEGTHLVVFDRDVVGVCRTRESPGRVDTVGYIERVLKPYRHGVELNPILRPDAMGILRHENVVAATLRVEAGNAQRLARMNRTLGGAANTLARETSSRAIGITMFADSTPGGRRGFKNAVLGQFAEIRDGDPGAVESLRVEYISEDAGRQVIELLGDDLTVGAEVDAPTVRRGLSQGDGVDAIRQAYAEAVEQINAALELDGD